MNVNYDFTPEGNFRLVALAKIALYRLLKKPILTCVLQAGNY